MLYTNTRSLVDRLPQDTMDSKIKNAKNSWFYLYHSMEEEKKKKKKYDNSLEIQYLLFDIYRVIYLFILEITNKYIKRLELYLLLVIYLLLFIKNCQKTFR